MRWGGDFRHEWSLLHSLRADVNGWCSWHNNSCRSNTLFWHYINPWKRSGNALWRHSVMWGLYLVRLLEISSAHRPLLCHNEMVVLSPITWKILITNTSALLVWQNKFYWLHGWSQIIIVLIVNKNHSLQQESFLSMHSVQTAHDNSFETSSACQSFLVIKGWFFFLQSCRNTDNEYICSRGGTEQVPLYCIVGNLFYISGT